MGEKGYLRGGTGIDIMRAEKPSGGKPMRTIGVGVIGWGFMGKTHTHALRSLPLFYGDAEFRVALKHVCSRRREQARRAAQEMGFERYTEDYRVLLEDPEVEVVSICTPNELHEEMAVAALKAGKHVYIDKPLSLDAVGAERIRAAAQGSGKRTRMVFNNRYLPAMLRAKALMDEGRVGEVLSFSVRYLHSGSIDPDKPIGWKQRTQGGVLLDLGSHGLDLVTWLTGYPRRVFCKNRVLYDRRPDGAGGTEDRLGEDHTLAMMELPNGALGTVEASKIATGTNDELLLEIRGVKGAIAWNSMDPGYLEFFDNTLPEQSLGGLRGFVRIESVGRYDAPGGAFLPPKNAVGWDRGHIHCYYTFLKEIAHGGEADNDVASGARLQRLIEALKQSDREHRWVDVDGCF